MKINAIVLVQIIILMFLNTVSADSLTKNSGVIELDSRIFLNIRSGAPLPTFDDVYNSYKKEYKNLTRIDCEKMIIACVYKLYDSIMFDTSKAYLKLLTIDNIICSLYECGYYSENIEIMLFKLYNSNYSRFIQYSSRMLYKYSNNWFTLSKNVIDSIKGKYKEQRITLYRELIDKLECIEPNEGDSVKYMAYYMLSREWSVFQYMDSIFVAKEPEYANSIQRLNFAKRVDSAIVKIEARENKKYENIKSDLDLFKKEAPYEYKIYQKLKNRRNLTNYTPPVLGSRK